MSRHFKMVADFYSMLGYTRPTGSNVGLPALNEDARESIRVMLREELKETLEAMDNEDDMAFLDGLADLTFVAMGAAWKIGANFDAVLEAVCRSNLTKTPGDLGRGFVKDAIKGENYKPPMLHKIPPFILWREGANIEEFVGSSCYAFHEAVELRARKAADYMSGGVNRGQYNPFGILSYAHNVIEKSMRVMSLVGSGKDPNFESLRDTLIDLILYAHFMIEFIDGKESNS